MKLGLVCFGLASVFVAACTITTTDGSSSSGGTSSSSSSGGASSTSSSGGSSSGSTGGCEFGEPNDTREQATAIELNRAYTGLCVSNPDKTDENDFFVVTAPSDAAGGFVEVQLTNVKDGGIGEINVFSVADNDSIIGAYTTTEGANVSVWFTVAPGAKYRIQITRFAGAGTRFAYDLQAKYTKVNDSFEPNNTKEEAKTIALNTPIQASTVAHSPNAKLAAGDDLDWYKVTLAAGTATIVLSNSPADYLCEIELLDANGTSVNGNYTTTPGANCQIDAQNLVGGTYFVKQHAFAGLPLHAKGNEALPPSITGLYTLEVKQ